MKLIFEIKLLKKPGEFFTMNTLGLLFLKVIVKSRFPAFKEFENSSENCNLLQFPPFLKENQKLITF
ncbi:MAG: hypothetical protein V4642_11590 [Bacteroidota bacterium]